MRRGPSSGPIRFFSPRINLQIDFGEGCVYPNISSLASSVRDARATDLLEEEKCHEPSNSRESRGDGTREEVRILLQKLAVAEQVGEAFRRTCKPSSNDGPVSRTSKGKFDASEDKVNSP